MNKLINALGSSKKANDDRGVDDRCFHIRMKRKDDPRRTMDFLNIDPDYETTTLHHLLFMDTAAMLRKGWKPGVKDDLKKGKKTIILTHTNNKNHSIQYARYRGADLQDIGVGQMWWNLPKDNNGFLDGAAFPILLMVDTKDVIDGGSESDLVLDVDRKENTDEEIAATTQLTQQTGASSSNIFKSTIRIVLLLYCISWRLNFSSWLVSLVSYGRLH